MSLTSHLDDPDSPITRFLKGRFPHAKPIRTDMRAALASTSTILPSDPTAFPWPIQGTAVDYRLRGYWEPVQFSDQARVGAMGLGDPEGPDAILCVGQQLDEMAKSIAPVGQRLVRQAEEWLARYCLVLAYFEVVFRSGRIPPEIQYAGRNPTPDALLAIPRQTAVDDLCELSWAFFDNHHELLSKPVFLNPTFAGSADAGGADADLVIGDCLWEIKTYKSPQSSKLSDTLYQLLGYVMLDYDDACSIRSVGIYFSRQATLVQWTLSDLMETMAGSSVPPLSELRSDFAIEGAKARLASDLSLRRAQLRPN